MKLITLVVSCYNSEKFVKDCFEKSYIDNDEIEYLFIDDGSSDNSVALAKEIADNHPNNVRIIQLPHGGCTILYDVAIKEAKGKYFFFLDIDDHIDKRIFLEALDILKANQELDVLLYDFATDFTTGRKSFVTNLKKFIKPNVITNVDEFKQMPLTVYFMNHNTIIRTDLVKGFMPPDTTLYSDSALVLYALIHSKQVYYSNKILYHYTVGVKGQTTAFSNTLKNYNQYFKNLQCLDYNFNDEIVNSLSRRRKKLVYHTTFLYIAAAIFFSFFNYSKEKKNEYVALKKEMKKRTPKIYKAVYYRTIFLISERFPKICLTPFCKLVQWIIRNRTPWEQ